MSTINVPTEHLLTALQTTLVAAGEDATQDAVAELSALLRLQLRHELQESSLWLVDAFDLLAERFVEGPLASASGNRPDLGSSSASSNASAALATPSSDSLETLSDRFIDGLCALMQRANFRLFSQQEWQFAQSENFMFTLPVDVSWEDLDSGMISRLFVRHPHLGLEAAHLARRVLVFHRGSGVAQTT